MDDILNLDNYVIWRPVFFALSTRYEAYNESGVKLIDIMPKLLVGNYILKDNNGTEIGEIHHKMVSLMPTYELYDGSRQLLGIVSEQITINLTGIRKFVLQDANGNKIASLAIPSPLAAVTQIITGMQTGTGYDITGADESTVIAKVSVQGADARSTKSKMASIKIQIINKNLPVLIIMELAIAIDNFYVRSMSRR